VISAFVFSEHFTVTRNTMALVAVSFADEPKPQWQRMLKGEDAKKAAELGKWIVALEALDLYSEAIRPELTAHDQALQQSGAALRRPWRIDKRSVLLEAFLIGEVAPPRRLYRIGGQRIDAETGDPGMRVVLLVLNRREIARYDSD
jgi:hypothetical protein